MTKINRINVQFHWSLDHTQDDIERAREAAQTALDRRGVTDYAALFAEVCAAVEEGREIPAIWRRAQYVAQRMGTLGFPKHHQVFVEIWV